MRDSISKRLGVPDSTSRAVEKGNKKKTIRARRQDGKKQIEKFLTE